MERQRITTSTPDNPRYGRVEPDFAVVTSVTCLLAGAPACEHARAGANVGSRRNPARAETSEMPLLESAIGGATDSRSSSKQRAGIG